MIPGFRAIPTADLRYFMSLTWRLYHILPLRTFGVLFVHDIEKNSTEKVAELINVQVLTWTTGGEERDAYATSSCGTA